MYSVGNRIGVGKESDIVVVAGPDGTQRILKIHRLGRISFRSVKKNRDYLGRRSTGSWMYMSRLAAIKEFTFMKALHQHGFPVPEPISQNRHTIVMSLVDAFPLHQIATVADPASLYADLMALILRLARYGLIHGDFNEFNILIKEEPVSGSKDKDGQEEEVRLVPVIIDFPQMVSIDHPNAEFYFDRDVECIKRYFQRRYHFTSDEPGPFFSEAKEAFLKNPGKRLDVEIEASGFSRKMAKELEKYMKELGVDGDRGGERDDLDDDDESEEEVEEGEGENDGNANESEGRDVNDTAEKLEDLRVSASS